MGLAEEIRDYIKSKGLDYVYDKVKNKLRQKKFETFCDELPGIIENKVLFPMQSTEYFTELQKFYICNKVIIRYLLSYLAISEESVTGLTDKFIKEFIKEYSHYGKYEVQLKKILDKSADIIKLELKNLGLLSNDKNNELEIVQNTRGILKTQGDISNNYHEINKKLDYISANISRIGNNLTEVLTDDNHISDNTEYAAEFKNIEKNYQANTRFRDAIIKYNELINDIRESGVDAKELLTNIYINLALCYTNIEDYTKAKKNLTYSEKYCDYTQNAKYYYIKAYTCWKNNQNNNRQYKNIDASEAIQLLDKAINIDDKYIPAIILRCELGALIKEDKEELFLKLDEVWKCIVNNTDNSRYHSSYYAARGIVSKIYADYEEAEKWMLKAEGEKHSVNNLINLGIIRYSMATKACEYGKRISRDMIDYTHMFSSLDYLSKAMEEILQSEDKHYDDQFLMLYVNVCIICERMDKLDVLSLSDTDMAKLDYDTKRNIIYHQMLCGNRDNIGYLSDGDINYITCLEMSENGNDDEALSFFKNKLNIGSKNEISRNYNLALQLALDIKRTEDYRSIRSEAIKRDIDCPYIELYDARYYELIGQKEKSKELYDKYIHSNDVMYIWNSIGFYRRNRYDEELKQIYTEILNKLGKHELAIYNPESLIYDAFIYLADIDIYTALDMYEKYADIFISNRQRIQIGEFIYFKVLDAGRLIELYEQIPDDSKTFAQKINYIILLKYILSFDKAKKYGEMLGNSYKIEDRENQIKYLELMSEVSLLDRDLDASVRYITEAKGLAKELVYNPVHQLYMSRLMRCGKEDGISYGIEFKNMHPNVATWIESMQAIEVNESGEKKLTDEFWDRINDIKEHYDNIIPYYDNEYITIYMLQKALGKDNDMIAMLGMPDNKQIKMVVNNDSNDNIIEKSKKISDAIVVDAMTLLFLNAYDVMELLDIFRTIYITYSSVEELEKIYVNYGGTMIENILEWLKSDLRIELYPSYNKRNEKDSFYHPAYFMDSIEAAKREDCYFFTIDGKVPRLFNKEREIFINVMHLVCKMTGEPVSRVILNLLSHNITFISFGPEDIIYALNRTNILLQDSLPIDASINNIINKMFSVNSTSDAISYLGVYKKTFEDIITCYGSKNAITGKFIECICRQLDRTYSRARANYLNYMENREESEYYKCIFYWKYNERLIIILRRLMINYNELWQKLREYPYRHMDVKILDKVDAKYGKGKKDITKNDKRLDEIARAYNFRQ